MDFEQAAGHAADLVQSLSSGARVRVISHSDADGIAAAAIMAVTLTRAGFRHHISIRHTGSTIAEGVTDDYDLAIFCDIGSSNLDELNQLPCQVILVDHHIIDGCLDNGINLNVRTYDMDGSREACGATATLALSLAISDDNLDLAELAIAGAIGDRQHVGGYTGLNESLLQRAIQAGIISLEDRPVFPVDVPLMDALEQSIDPYFTGFAGGGAIRFLKDLDIDPMQTYTDLPADRQKKLLSALALKLLEQQATEITLQHTTPIGQRYGTLSDLTSKMNACARSNHPGIGIALCLGSSTAMEKATELQQDYRDSIRKEMRSLEKEQPEQRSHLTSFHIKDASLKGVAAGLSMEYLPHFPPDRPVIALSRQDSVIDVSSRGTRRLVEQGLNLAAGLQQAAAAVGGSGGGHPVAAGASIPKDKEKDFLDTLNEVLSRQ
ncbi:MAG: DHHA1 domain-containing protein [Thermoplasmatota archaeon]